MEPVECALCHARVEVRKSSWAQTSVQWTQETSRVCVERRAWADAPADRSPVFSGCTSLRDSIREAAVRGEIEVLDDGTTEADS